MKTRVSWVIVGVGVVGCKVDVQGAGVTTPTSTRDSDLRSESTPGSVGGARPSTALPTSLPQSPSASALASPSPATPTSTATGERSYAKLTAANATEAKYTIDGKTEAALYFAAQNMSLSAKCKKADGTLDCDAIKFLRSGTEVAIPKSKLTGAISGGTLVCRKLGHTVVTAKNAKGDEDGMCKFPDGSLVSVGALEHQMKTE